MNAIKVTLTKTIVLMTLVVSATFTNIQTGAAQSKKQIKAELEQARLDTKEAQEALVKELQKQSFEANARAKEAEGKAQKAETEVKVLTSTVVVLTTENDQLKGKFEPKKIEKPVQVKKPETTDSVLVIAGKKIRFKSSNGKLFSIEGETEGLRPATQPREISIYDISTGKELARFRMMKGAPDMTKGEYREHRATIALLKYKTRYQGSKELWE